MNVERLAELLDDGDKFCPDNIHRFSILVEGNSESFESYSDEVSDESWIITCPETDPVSNPLKSSLQDIFFPKKAKPPKHPLLYSSILMILFCLLSVFQNLLHKILFDKYNIGVFQQIYLMSWGSTLILPIIMCYSKISLFGFPRKAVHILYMRCILGFLSKIFFILGLKQLSLSTQSGIFYTNPLFTNILSWFLIGEKFFVPEIIYTIVSVCGLCIALMPNESLDTYLSMYYTIIAGILSALGYSIRSHTSSQLTYFNVQMHFGLFRIVICPIFFFWKFETHWNGISFEIVIIALGLGFMQIASLWAMNTAFKFTKPIHIAYLSNFQFIFALLLDLFNGYDIGKLTVVIGILLMIFARFVLSLFRSYRDISFARVYALS